MSGISDLSILEQLFVGKTHLPPGAYKLNELAPGEVDRMKAKAAEGNMTIKKFKKLYGYK